MNYLFKYKFFVANLLTSYSPSKYNSNRVLLYHEINKKYQNNIFSVDEYNFELQMNEILNNNFNIVKLSDNDSGHNNISICFDDGYVNNYEIAAPILKKLKIPATFFITTSKINKDKNYMTTNHLLELDDNVFDFGIHGHDHLSFGDLDNNKISYQINKSREFLENIFKKKINLLSYPNGSVNNRVKKIVKECGISKAYDSSSRTYNPDFKTLDLFQIPRLSIWNIDSLKSFKNKIFGKWDWIS